MWEYKLLVLELSDLQKGEDTLNGEGRDGWEVVAVLPKSAIMSRPVKGDCLAVMKRRKEHKEGTG